MRKNVHNSYIMNKAIKGNGIILLVRRSHSAFAEQTAKEAAHDDTPFRPHPWRRWPRRVDRRPDLRGWRRFGHGRGPYDHIVTTAADLAFAPFPDLSDDAIEAMLRSKFRGPINLARAAGKHLAPQGSVLFFSGLAAYRQGPGSSIVGALNMALESLAAALAIEMKPRRFNVISPGIVDSETWAGMTGADRSAFFGQIAAGLPAGRVGTVEDEAHAALALLENGFINGTVVNVDGGGRIA
ncbi:SDR family oxidoreductase [Novosphingobium sp. 1949]|uniref:SDR family oxidoreductase n=1 Tax=Novosphingobium organovorum TaxID=2930092 RepID=A0ABT0BCG1_9SPHN|nr:SDR family oxidoreductase [Novosphingobium organovorum]MCJ2182538.1 SDR family oxidoreductase [Novosphingobium organovorum]